MTKENNNRWWEFYLVRYFVGTVVGTIIVLVLTYHPNSSIGGFVNFKEFMNKSGGFNFEIGYLWLFGLIGLAYCYLSSAPILVLHTFRSSIFYNAKGVQMALILLLVLLVILGAILFYNRTSYHWILLAFVTAAQVYMIVYDIVRPKVFQSYKILTELRANANTRTQEYIESYRHLREHGNAFIILLMEIMFAIILFRIESYAQLVIVVIIWILPACTAWFVGCYLESRLKKV